MDPALGAIDRSLPCASCGMDEQECPGHFGHLELAKPMYHTSFIKTTLKTLRCVCFSCSEILADEPPPDGQPTQDSRRLGAATKKRNPVQRLRAVMDLCKTKGQCWSCSQPQPNYKQDGLTILAEFKEAPCEFAPMAALPSTPSSLFFFPVRPSGWRCCLLVCSARDAVGGSVGVRCVCVWV